MKYLAIAGLVAFAAATPQQWEPVDPKPTTTSTWSEIPKTPVYETSTWSEVPKKPETWSEVPKKADPTWSEWEKKPIWTTTVVTAITTYCPEATTLYHAGKTYKVEKATTLTITDCPCTISVPVYTKTSTSCAETKTPVKPDEAQTWANTPVKGDQASTWAPYPAPTDKKPVADATTWASWSPVKASPAIPTWTGAANKLNVGAGFGAIVGAAALLL